jgi:hypothetical protein
MVTEPTPATMSDAPITPEQVKAARRLLGWTPVRMAARADASELAVRRYENGRGIEFIAETCGGAGVRLRKGQ